MVYFVLISNVEVTSSLNEQLNQKLEQSSDLVSDHTAEGVTGSGTDDGYTNFEQVMFRMFVPAGLGSCTLILVAVVLDV